MDIKGITEQAQVTGQSKWVAVILNSIVYLTTKTKINIAYSKEKRNRD